jgi:hypothetical protein
VPNASVSIPQGGSEPITAEASLPGGTLTILGLPTLTIYKPDRTSQQVDIGDVVTGPLETVSGTYLFDTATFPTPGTYLLRFHIDAEGSDGREREFEPLVEVRVLPVLLGGPPTGDDLANFILSLGILDPAKAQDAFDLMQLERKASAVFADWQKRTGWNPYLATAAVRTYDPPGPNYEGLRRGGGRILMLHAGLLQLNSITAGVTLDNPGVPLNEGGDFWRTDAAGQYNYAMSGRPAERIEFAMPQVGPPNSMVIDGVWGRVYQIEDDVFEGLVHYGAYLAFSELSLSISKGLFEYKDLQTTVRFAGAKQSPLSEVMPVWQADFNALVLRNTRIEI